MVRASEMEKQFMRSEALSLHIVTVIIIDTEIDHPPFSSVALKELASDNMLLL